jgi:hypothetical protein
MVVICVPLVGAHILCVKFSPIGCTLIRIARTLLDMSGRLFRCVFSQ